MLQRCRIEIYTGRYDTCKNLTTPFFLYTHAVKLNIRITLKKLIIFKQFLGVEKGKGRVGGGERRENLFLLLGVFEQKIIDSRYRCVCVYVK